jgi:hypothetical protein
MKALKSLKRLGNYPIIVATVTMSAPNNCTPLALEPQSQHCEEVWAGKEDGNDVNEVEGLSARSLAVPSSTFISIAFYGFMKRRRAFDSELSFTMHGSTRHGNDGSNVIEMSGR